MSRVCISIFAADGFYRSYIPMFLFCLFKAYPDYDAVIFLRKPLGHVEKPGMKLIKNMGNFRLVYDDSLAIYPKLQDRERRVKQFQAIRFLALTPKNVKKCFSDYDYIYTTDVDMLIMPEAVPLHEQHLQHMETLGLPYSNFIRNTDPPRLTGLHFGTRQFFEKTAPLIIRYASKIVAKGWSIITGLGERGPDEALWYRIVKESGFSLPPKCPYSEQETWEKVFDPDGYGNVWFGPHHGVHVGFGRAMNRFRPIFNLPFYRQYMHSLSELMTDERFGVLYNGLHTRAKAALKAVIKEGRSG